MAQVTLVGKFPTKSGTQVKKVDNLWRHDAEIMGQNWANAGADVVMTQGGTVVKRFKSAKS